MFPSRDHTLFTIILFFSDGKWCVLEYLKQGKAELTAVPMNWVDWQSFILHWPVDHNKAVTHHQPYTSKDNVWHPFTLKQNLGGLLERDVAQRKLLEIETSCDETGR